LLRFRFAVGWGVVQALELELTEEMEQLRERIEEWPVERLVQQGYCATGLAISADEGRSDRGVLCHPCLVVVVL
jgi:predicted outer membrane lipoprotein